MEEYERSATVARISAAVGGGARDAKRLAPLTLAYIGDTVYDLYVRTLCVTSTDLTVKGLHAYSAKRVCAAAQARALSRVEAVLSIEEQDIVRRGRNAHMGTVPKNADIRDYRAATGLEALVGYLYLTGLDARLDEIMRIALREEQEE